ncbi:phytanoyl-CoA dioxygenase family protein [Nostoc sp. LEGE 12447]|uniref:phytanoyl-CoA dioxygenase family protein n=1 Tax=Nostoc sp. LEGE 12447 TaxID=1828640 RepID=UPI0018840B2D|nr:phytanoyl-CoA dioxygenase family protein [Nostoc sp. LEGE 12447]MBE8998668.1 phytanoyl-CoA dioxygenase family protein [Nostoc sp. LEGE 12447]
MIKIFSPHLDRAQLELLPTAQDVAFYEEHGWYISKKVIPDEMIDAAILASEKFYLGERDAKLPSSTGYSNWKLGDENAIRNNEFVSLQNNVLREFALQPIIGAIAARLTKSKGIRLFEDQLVYKAPHSQNGKGVVGWHTDSAYCSTCTSDKLLAAWIPFHDCDESRAPLVVIDGSHKWSGNEHLRYFNQQNLKDIEQKFAQTGRKIIEVPMILEKGQMSFHNCRTIHGSYPNYSDLFRLAIAVHLQDDDNRYQAFWNPPGKRIHHFLDSICRKLPNGNPDYSDPAIFPVLWSAKDR